MMTTEDPRPLPPGWNAMEFVTGNEGNDNVDSCTYLRANLFSCIALAGVGVGGGADDGGNGRRERVR
jgi:hypothetical protein